MAQRIIIGQHPFGSYGLFVSRPGFDASQQDPNARDPWLFSSNWSRIGSILGSGTCTRGNLAYHYNPGYLPQVIFERYAGDSVFQDEAVVYQSSNDPNASNITVTVTNKYQVFHMTGDSFKIDRPIPVANDTDNSTFKYVVLALQF